MDLALNNLQRLICHKTQQTKPNLPTICLQIKYVYLYKNKVIQKCFAQLVGAVEYTDCFSAEG